MRLAVIAGDGIGPEVVGEALKVFTEVVPDVATTTYDLGAARWHATGELLPDQVLAELREHDDDPARRGRRSVGAQWDPRSRAAAAAASTITTSTCASARLYPGVQSPLSAEPEIDLVVVREGTELYVGTGGFLRKDTPQEVATEVSVNTAFGVERVVRDAFARAERPQAPSRWCTRRTC